MRRRLWHRRLILAAAALATMSARASYGGEYTWDNTTGNWSDPAHWGGTAPTGTDGTDILRFGPPAASFAATLDQPPLPSPFLLNQLIFSGQSPPNYAHSYITGGVLQFTGANPQIVANSGTGIIRSVVQVSGDLALTSNGSGAIILLGTLSGVGNMIYDRAGFVSYAQPSIPGFTGSLTVRDDPALLPAAQREHCFSWNPFDQSPLQNAVTRVSLGGQPIVLDGGTFRLSLESAQPPQWPASPSLVVTNPIRVTSNGGKLQTAFPDTPNFYGSLNLTYEGDIDLGGTLYLHDWGYPWGRPIYHAPVTINQDPSNSADRAIVGMESLDYLQTIQLTRIADGPGGAARPLHLGGPLTIGGTGQTYAGGTIIEPGGVISVAASAQLGTGPVTVRPGGLLLLGGPSNIDPNGGGNHVLVETGAFLSIGSNNDYSPKIDPKSTGAIGFANGVKYTGDLDFRAGGFYHNMSFGGGRSVQQYAVFVPSPVFSGRFLYDDSHPDFVWTGPLDYAGPSALADRSTGEARKLVVSSGGVILRQSNTYSGGTEIAAGATVEGRAQGALGTGPISTFGQLKLGSVAQTLDNAITLSNDPSNWWGICGLSGDHPGIVVKGPLTVNAPAPGSNQNLRLVLGGALTIAGPVKVNGKVTFEPDSSGAFVWSPSSITGAWSASIGSSVSPTSVGPIMFNGSQSLPDGNIEAHWGILIFGDHLTWNQFLANRSGGVGSGDHQWQILGKIGLAGKTADGSNVVIDATRLPSSFFKHGFSLGAEAKNVDGSDFANAGITLTGNVNLSSQSQIELKLGGRGIYGQGASGVTHLMLGRVTGGALALTGPGNAGVSNAIGELVLGDGAMRWQGSAMAYASGFHDVNSGTGGMTINGSALVRFNSNDALPTYDDNTIAYLACVNAKAGGFLLTASPNAQLYKLPQRYQFLIGGPASATDIAGGIGSSSADGRGGSATLAGSTILMHTRNADDPLAMQFIVRDGQMTLGDALAGPVVISPSTGFTAEFPVANDGTGQRIIHKVGTGTLVLNDLRYRRPASGADAASQFSWQIDSGTLEIPTGSTHVLPGLVAVNDGAVLRVNGILDQRAEDDAGGLVIAGAGAIVSGSGRIRGSLLMQSGSRLAPDLPGAPLSIDTLTLDNGSVYDWKLEADGYDRADVGTLIAADHPVIRLSTSGVQPRPDAEYVVLTFQQTSGMPQWTIDYAQTGWTGGELIYRLGPGSGGEVVLRGLEIPEPGSVVLLGVAAGWSTRRRKRQRAR